MANKFRDFITQALEPRSKLQKVLLSLILLSLMICSAINLRFSVRALSEPYIYVKDFLQEYLMARSILSGENPYTPLPELVDHFFGKLAIGDILMPVLPNVSPHPPSVSILFLPFGMSPYREACILWFIIEIILVIASALLIVKSLNIKAARFRTTLLLSLILLAWNPFYVDLVFGQLMILILFLLCLTWYSFINKKFIWAGIWLGLSISIKLISWPLVIWLILIKQFRIAASAIFTFIILNLVGAIIIGPQVIVDYYRVIGPQVYQLYSSSSANFSITGLVWRVFSGTNSEGIEGIQALPLVNLPTLASTLTPVIILAAVILVLLTPVCKRDPKAGFVILLILCVLVSPVTWNHYFVLLSIPLTFAYHRLLVAPKADLYLGLILLFTTFILAIPITAFSDLTIKIAGLSMDEIGFNSVSFWTGLISYIPAFSIMILTLLVIRISGVKETQSNLATD